MLGRPVQHTTHRHRRKTLSHSHIIFFAMLEHTHTHTDKLTKFSRCLNAHTDPFEHTRAHTYLFFRDARMHTDRSVWTHTHTERDIFSHDECMCMLDWKYTHKGYVFAHIGPFEYTFTHTHMHTCTHARGISFVILKRHAFHIWIHTVWCASLWGSSNQARRSCCGQEMIRKPFMEYVRTFKYMGFAPGMPGSLWK